MRNQLSPKYRHGCMEWDRKKCKKIGKNNNVCNTTPILRINFQVIKRGIVTIINGREIILMEEMDKIQIGHIKTM